MLFHIHRCDRHCTFSSPVGTLHKTNSGKSIDDIILLSKYSQLHAKFNVYKAGRSIYLCVSIGLFSWAVQFLGVYSFNSDFASSTSYGDSSALAMEFLQSCAKPSISPVLKYCSVSPSLMGIVYFPSCPYYFNVPSSLLKSDHLCLSKQPLINIHKSHKYSKYWIAFV